MIGKYKINSHYTKAEKFVGEKLLELIFYKTLDSHRAKLNNPKWVLVELSQVLKDWNEKKIKNFERTIRPVILEAIQLLQEDSTLIFTIVDLSYYKTLLGEAKEDKYTLLFQATNLVLKSNADYMKNLFELIRIEIDRMNGVDAFQLNELVKLDRLLDYLATELVNHGYSKAFLYGKIGRLFNDESNVAFQEAYNQIAKLSTDTFEEFIVVFRLYRFSGKSKDIELKSQFELSTEQKAAMAGINEKTKMFFSREGQNYYYLGINAKGLDYLAVIEKAKKQLLTLIDLLHLGFPDNPFDIHNRCLVLGSRKPEFANIQPVNYITDGYYKNNQALYEQLLFKIKTFSSKNIARESMLKIISAFRYLRLGRDADELQQKFINYWIGLEYIFSNYDIGDNTINRLKEYFIHAHSLSYVKRNLKEFAVDLERLKLHEVIPNYNKDLSFLLDPTTYDFIITTYADQYPLLAYRALTYRNLITDEKQLGKIIRKHRTNLEWHLTRCYRIRNEIVHDAAIHLNIESITGNLKYYLTFILSGLIEFLETTPSDMNMQGQLSIEDYFQLQEIRYNSMTNKKLNIKHFMLEKSATELFLN